MRMYDTYETDSNNHKLSELSYTKNEHSVIDEIMAYLECGAHIVFVCAEPYMGKTRILSQVILRCLNREVPAKYVDFLQTNERSSFETLNDIARWSKKQGKGKKRLSTTTGVVVACDNMSVCDEADAERIMNVLRRMQGENVAIVVSMLPENEMLVERMGESVCFWSCDLKIPMQDANRDAETIDAYSKGIPVLTQALSRVDEEAWVAPITDPSYMDLYMKVVESTVRDVMMHEEKRLRCAMHLLGYGRLSDLEDILGDVDEGIWRALARDAPFFDVDLLGATFDCVGGRSNDCLNVMYSALKCLVGPWPMFVYRTAFRLAKRGDFARAAIVSLMCENEEKRCSICLEWSIHMVDVGEVVPVSDAVETAKENRLTSLPGFVEASCVLDALKGGDLRRAGIVFDDQCMSSPYAKHVALALGCRGTLQGAQNFPAWECFTTGEDVLCETLASLGYAMSLMLAGRIGEAYDHLLTNAVRVDGHSISSGLLSMVYVLCSLLMGIVPSPYDLDAELNAVLLYERSGLIQLCSLHDAVLESGKILSGQMTDSGVLESHIQRATRSHDVLLRGFYLLAASVSDMRIGAYTRSHVRLLQAMSVFDDIHCLALQKVSHLFDLTVRAELGEHVGKRELEECYGISRSMDAVVSFSSIALLQKGKATDESLGWCETSPCPREVHWVLNVLMNDAATVSKGLRKIVPPAWRDAVRRSSCEVDEFFQRVRLSESAGLPQTNALAVSAGKTETDKDTQHCVEVCMLGGFDVYVNGTHVPVNRIERRRAKALLALLTAIPGHTAKRFVIIESIWPTYDYQSANKCVYSATSVLRSEIKGLLGRKNSPPVVYSSKAEASVSLNVSIFTCDVDAFEEKARNVLDMEGSDREVVALSRELEELYKGDLFVPPTDGMGVVQTRAQELKDLYADSMIVAANAASNLGMKTLACRFAQRAHAADGLREDAVRILVIALCTAGRKVEAERCYEKYVGHVVDIARRPPSRRLREEMQSVLGNNQDAAGARTRLQRRGDPDVQVLDAQVTEEGEQLGFCFTDEE